MILQLFLLCLLLILLLCLALFVIICIFASEMPTLRTIRRTLIRDIRGFTRYFTFIKFLKTCLARNRSIPDFFSEIATKYRDRVCFIYEDQEWTFQQVDEFSNRLANAFLAKGYQKGDEVALLMDNCPEFICIWLGMAKIGVVTALINNNVRQETLGHSINILDIKAILFGENMSDVLQEALPFIKNRDTIEYYSYSDKNKTDKTLPPFPTKSLNALLDEASTAKINLGDRKLGFEDKLLYVYTSGTTGLPKAAIIRNSRFLWMCGTPRYLIPMSGFQIFYNTLPLYHTSGGIIFVGFTLVFGSTMVIRKKFSASNFWKDCVKHKVTASQYIGEICRYLLNQPKTPEETQHSVKFLYGNGLKPLVWKEFQERFRIERILEFYGSTEGNANLLNMFDVPGKVGFVSRIADKIYPLKLLKVNQETGELVRDEKGLCIRCKPDEPGELVAKIIRNTPINSFDGYVNQNETNKKITRNCFKHGDAVFLSGDILVMDEDGNFSFVDRTGDTFRWKGENVSTGEVENIISTALSHVAVVVYGVEIPNVEGRAGMAAIQMNLKDINSEELYEKITKKLPGYAVPLFIRATNIDMTGTYKLVKGSLQKEGFNPEVVSDPLFFLDHKQKIYVPLTKELHSDISTGVVKL